jgi:hypothetical protein
MCQQQDFVFAQRASRLYVCHRLANASPLDRTGGCGGASSLWPMIASLRHRSASLNTRMQRAMIGSTLTGLGLDRKALAKFAGGVANHAFREAIRTRVNSTSARAIDQVLQHLR